MMRMAVFGIALLMGACGLAACEIINPPITCEDDPTMALCQPLGIRLVAGNEATCACIQSNPDAGAPAQFRLVRDTPGKADDNFHVCAEHTSTILCDGAHNGGADFICSGGGDNERPGKLFEWSTNTSGCEFRSSKIKTGP